METDTEMLNKKLKGNHRVVLITVLSLIIIAVSLAAIGVFYINQKLNLIDYNSGNPASTDDLVIDNRAEVDIGGLEVWEAPILSKSAQTLELADDDGIFNIMLLGTDGRTEEYTDNARADCTMLLSLNLEDHSAYLTSFERGIGMPITSGPNKGKYDLLTHIFRHGGAAMVVEDIRECFNVDVEHYVHINFSSLIDVVDILGGINIELTEEEAWYLNSVQSGRSVSPYLNQGYFRYDSDAPEHEFVAGTNKLTGTMALAYVRLRGIDSNWHRIERQRNVIQACAYAIEDADLVTLNSLANQILPLVQTNLTKEEIGALILALPGFLGVEFEQLTVPAEGSYGGMTGIYGASMLAVDFDYNSALLHDFIYGQ